jgi:hypothetical protein
MVQTMETWFIADINALMTFYGQGFREDKIHSALTRYTNVEQVSKATVQVMLAAATRPTERGKYHKTNHAPKLLELLDVSKVRQASPYCDRLFTKLQEKMKP